LSSLVCNTYKKLAVSLNKIAMKKHIVKSIVLLIPFTFISCNSEMSMEKKFEVTYSLHIEENNKYNESLIENIKNKMSEITNPETVKKLKICDSLSKDYFDYLTTVEKEVKEQGNELFFEGDLYSKKGKTYAEKSENYKTEIEKLTNSANFIKRLNSVFSMKDVKFNNIYISNLDYFFRGFPKIQSSAFISDKKRRVLEFENELIAEIIIANK